MSAYAEHVSAGYGDPEADLLSALESEDSLSLARYAADAAEPFEDRLLTKTEAARAAGISMATLDTYAAEGIRPWTYWRSDVLRWATSLKAGEPGCRR